MSKYLLVTGASQGLGLALSKLGLAENYTVFSLDRCISDELASQKSDRLNIFPCDITNQVQIDKCREKISKITDRIDLQINCAGIWLDSARMELKDARFDFDLVYRQLDVNAVGTLRMMREFIPFILRSQMKTIINISSEAAGIGNCRRKGEYGYCMSKAALNMATKLTSNAYPEIKIYAVHPGWMQTPQGYAGANGISQPSQSPYDTARCLFELAKAKRKDYMFCDYTGKKLDF